MIWSVHEGRGRTPFLSTNGYEGPRRKPFQDQVGVYPRRAANNTFCLMQSWSSITRIGEKLILHAGVLFLSHWRSHPNLVNTQGKRMSTKGAHKGRPYQLSSVSGQEGPRRKRSFVMSTRSAPTSWSSITRILLSSLREKRSDSAPAGVLFLSHCDALGRAPTRGAPSLIQMSTEPIAPWVNTRG